jgi:hypothetical protein
VSRAPRNMFDFPDITMVEEEEDDEPVVELRLPSSIAAKTAQK